ncbi:MULTISPECIES: plastocyanin/azurin family copper-binding protein [Methylosinus]|uniref:plastocyanin/azurin family copper-binding protein n=1 Tax=Methylosinus TaxID=425 RepID=UPI00163DE2F9|nr:plastocyanin/azurin family copper-binding protein [Methylosinus sporium]MBU3887474.1 cupredoxin domain-containing protein [Methylosinus sp. KRF6]
MRTRALLAASALSFGPSVAAEVRIENFAFTPAHLTVKAGDTIVFVNRDQAPHSIIGAMGKEEIFHSPEQMDEDESFRVTLPRPGEVSFRCGLHSHMSGTISVIP